MNKKYKYPAPKCSLNKKGFCCNHCKRTKYCLEVCKNDVNKLGLERPDVRLVEVVGCEADEARISHFYKWERFK